MADDRLSAALAFAIQAAAARLVPVLETANGATYLATMQRIAASFGQSPPDQIADAGVLFALAQRAQVSATSIATTQATRRAALVASLGIAAAQVAYRAWEKQQRVRIIAYETALAAYTAAQDFQDRNNLTGLEHIEPAETNEHDMCDAAIAQGDQPIGTLGGPWPAHLNCPHHLVRTYADPHGAEHLWFGG